MCEGITVVLLFLFEEIVDFCRFLKYWQKQLLVTPNCLNFGIFGLGCISSFCIFFLLSSSKEDWKEISVSCSFTYKCVSVRGPGSCWRAEPSTARIVLRHLSRGTISSLQLLLFTLLVLLASVLASAKPAWLNFGQHRGPTYSYNDGSKKRQNWWARFTISIANNKHNTKGHRVIKTKDLNKKWLAAWQLFHTSSKPVFQVAFKFNREINTCSSFKSFRTENSWLNA